MLKHYIEEWETNSFLIQDLSELPQWFKCEHLYLDVETTSGHPKLKSVNPWHNCKLLGISVIVDDEASPIYLPLRHRATSNLKNLPYEGAMEWIRKVMAGAKYWVNHNIKYDAHVLANEGIDFREYGVELIDTLVLAKMAPYEERMSYNLTDIMNEWLYINIEPYEIKIKSYLKKGEHDYGLIPMDIMSPYSCVDVLCVRELRKQFDYSIPAECHKIRSIEMGVTAALFDVEREGMCLDLNKLEMDKLLLAYELDYVLAPKIEELVGIPHFRPHVNGDCASFFIEKLGLPVLEYTNDPKSKRASFGEHALLAYKALRSELTEVVDLILKYKEKYKLFSSFTLPYCELQVEGRIHSNYNQIVRTGRMSCRDPNMQQLSPEAKAYVIAPNGWSIVDIDFSQIEFRLIAHFIQAAPIIEEFNRNAAADYHQIVADICGIARKPAKTMNFMLGYGGGRSKCVEVLSSIPEVIGELKDKKAIEERANRIYETYHKMVPTLKNTTWIASKVMRQRGYVRTLLGRHRYLPHNAHFKAFNSVVQGSAADLFKAAVVRLHEHCKTREDVKVVGFVHDSFLLYIRKESLGTIPYLVKLIEELPPGVQVRVPIRAEAKISETNWKECK